MWSIFVAKHNVAFLNSDHAKRLFREMFPDSAIAKRFACGCTKTTAIVKEALTPHYHNKVVNNLSYPFSILMDESNDKVNNTCIILVKVHDSEVAWIILIDSSKSPLTTPLVSYDEMNRLVRLYAAKI